MNNVDIRTLGVFGASFVSERQLFSLPEIPKKRWDAARISKYLEKNMMIGWYCLCDAEDSLWLYRAENGLLWRYSLKYTSQEQWYATPEEVILMTRENMEELCHSELSLFGRIYRITKEKAVDYNIQTPVLTVTEEEIRDHMKGRGIYRFDGSEFALKSNAKTTGL